MTPDQFRRLALGLPDATESAHMGHPDFRVRNKIFATLHPDGRQGMVKLTPDQQADLLELPPGGAFVPSAGAWGRQGCTNVLLEAADRKLVAEALGAAWRNAAPLRKESPMPLIASLVLALAAAGAPDPAAEVRAAESAFAAAFADRDRGKFFSLVSEDAVFLSPRETLTGKAQVVKGWSRFFEGAAPPFSWRPERVTVNGAGDLGLSIGPVFDPAGKQVGNFSSVWRKQKDGSWKVVFDGPGSPVCPPAEKK